jgi:hypothetical protein
MPIAAVRRAVIIRFTSSLTPDDENKLAAALLQAMTSILDALPIAYVVRIDTSDANVYQRTSPLVADGPLGPRAANTAS